jgi:hypothetical protein
MLRILSLFVVITLSISFAHSQKILDRSYPTGRLPWTQGTLPANSSYVQYKVVYAEENSLNDARDEAFGILVTDLGKDQGVTINDRTIQQVKEVVSSDSPDFFTRSSSRNLEVKFDDYELSFLKVDEYFERVEINGVISYKLWQLFALSGYQDIQSLQYTSKYPGITTVKSVLVPGWGQFDKKQTLKGLLFLGAAGAAAGVSLKANNDYNYYINRREESTGIDLKKQFQKEADNSLALRNISLAALGGIWLYNIIDAATPNGAPRYAAYGFNLDLTSNNNEKLALNIKYKF